MSLEQIKTLLKDLSDDELLNLPIAVGLEKSQRAKKYERLASRLSGSPQTGNSNSTKEPRAKVLFLNPENPKDPPFKGGRTQAEWYSAYKGDKDKRKTLQDWVSDEANRDAIRDNAKKHNWNLKDYFDWA